MFPEQPLPRMQNRLPSSTKNSYRKEERDSRVFLKAYGKVLSFNSHRLFGVDENLEHPDDCERAASLEWHTQLAFKNDMLDLRKQQLNTWKEISSGENGEL